MTEEPVVTKRGDPNYISLTGYIEKRIGLRFKAIATLNEKSQSVALEEAIRDYVEKHEKKSKS
jgi:predicted transcriptional regulator